MDIATSTKTPSGRVALKSHYITPAECNIPSSFREQKTLHHIPIRIGAQNTLKYPIDETKLELDGFYLLECSGQGFPEDVQQVVIVDRGLRSVLADDLIFFTQLLYIDLSENSLPLFPFGALPNLVELRIACNKIERIDQLLGFHRLMYLDLSYNSLTVESIEQLDVLINLKELDMSGNNLEHLPSDMTKFIILEKIILDYNKFENNNIFIILSTIPNLRHVGLANNFLSYIPTQCSQDFRLLETLDVSFNYFGAEIDIEPVVLLPRLTTLMLYGNPILGPTGEDPMYIYIEDLVEATIEQRERDQRKDLDFVTEVPRKRNLKKGQPSGRQLTYRDFTIIQVDDAVSTKLLGTWRKEGNRTLFAEAMANRSVTSPQKGQGSPVHIPPDNTFLTSVAHQSMVESVAGGSYISVESLNGVNGSYGDKSLARQYTNQMQIDAIADDVMKKVADEMGLLNSAEVLMLKDKIKIPLSSHMKNQPGYALKGTFLKPNEQFSLSPTGSTSPLASNEEAQEGVNEIDQLFTETVPTGLFDTSIDEMKTHNQTLSGQPIPLKTAIKSLQMILKYPLTDYDEVPSKWSQSAKEYIRPTQSSINRQIPRRLESGDEKLNTNLEDRLDQVKRKYNVKGLSEPRIEKQLRESNRLNTLNQLEDVLDNLNDHISHNLAKPQNAMTMTSKDNFHRMKSFIHKPSNGIKNLINMATAVSEEFQD
eukprot:gene13247-17753_t